MVSAETGRTQYAIDISNYTGELSGEQVTWIGEHYDLAIVRLSTEDGAGQRGIAAQQVAALAAGAVPWQGYLWMYWDESATELWRRAQEYLPAGWPGYERAAIWIDCEDSAPRPSECLDRVNAYARLLELDGFVPGIYTGRWWIDQHSAAFEGPNGRYWRSFPLWWASYSGHGHCQHSNIEPWAEVAMHQFRAVDTGEVLRSYDESRICRLI